MKSLNDALSWLTIESYAGTPDVQIWFSTYGLTSADVAEIEKKWEAQLKRILA